MQGCLTKNKSMIQQQKFFVERDCESFYLGTGHKLKGIIRIR